MPKRLTNTEKWKTSFFKSLPCEYQLLWLYINDDCDFCGVWMVDFEVAAIRINGVNEKKAAELFSSEIQVLPSGDWFIPSFIDTQYGEFSERNSIHRKVAATLTAKHAKHGMYTKCIQDKNSVESHWSTVNKNKNKNKNNVGISFSKENKKEPEKSAEVLVWPSFDDFWTVYDKKIDRKLCEPIWDKLDQDAKEQIMLHIPEYKKQFPEKRLRKDPVRYLRNESWKNEIYNNYEQPKLLTRDTRHEPFTAEVSATVQDKFAAVAKQRAAQRGGYQPSPEPGDHP